MANEEQHTIEEALFVPLVMEGVGQGRQTFCVVCASNKHDTAHTKRQILLPCNQSNLSVSQYTTTPASA